MHVVPGTIKRVLMKANLISKKDLSKFLKDYNVEYVDSTEDLESYVVYFDDGSPAKYFSKSEWMLGGYDETTLGDVVASVELANLVTSKIDGQPGMHALVVDLDIPHTYVPSTTPGHGHLYLDVPMTTELAMSVLEFLSDVGVVEPGYYKASKKRGYSAVRLPWVKKEEVVKSGY